MFDTEWKRKVKKWEAEDEERREGEAFERHVRRMTNHFELECRLHEVDFDKDEDVMAAILDKLGLARRIRRTVGRICQSMSSTFYGRHWRNSSWATPRGHEWSASNVGMGLPEGLPAATLPQLL